MISHQLFRKMIDSLPMPAFITNTDGVYVFVNQSFERLFEVESAKIVGLKPIDAGAVQAPMSDDPMLGALRPTLPIRPAAITETFSECPETKEVFALGIVHVDQLDHWRTDQWRDEQLEVAKLRADLGDARQQLRRLRETDPVTQCVSRRALRAEVNNSTPAGVLRIAIDDFAATRAEVGDEAADALLAAFSQIVHTDIRPDDVFARIGAADFTMILRGANREQTAMVARRIAKSITEARLGKDAASRELSISIGGACSTAPNAQLSKLIGEADEALTTVEPLGNQLVMV